MYRERLNKNNCKLAIPILKIVTADLKVKSIFISYFDYLKIIFLIKK